MSMSTSSKVAMNAHSICFQLDVCGVKCGVCRCSYNLSEIGVGEVCFPVVHGAGGHGGVHLAMSIYTIKDQ